MDKSTTKVKRARLRIDRLIETDRGADQTFRPTDQDTWYELGLETRTPAFTQVQSKTNQSSISSRAGWNTEPFNHIPREQVRVNWRRLSYKPWKWNNKTSVLSLLMIRSSLPSSSLQSPIQWLTVWHQSDNCGGRWAVEHLFRPTLAKCWPYDRRPFFFFFCVNDLFVEANFILLYLNVPKIHLIMLNANWSMPQ